MWYKREIIRNHKVVVMIKADNLEEAQNGFDEWISKAENRIAVDNAFKDKIASPLYHDDEFMIWSGEGSDQLPHYLDYDFDIAIKKKDESNFVNVIIDYSEDTNVPFAIRSKRYYFKKTPEEVWNILKFWREDFYVFHKSTMPAEPQYHKKYETLIYKATLREKENK